MFGGTRSTCDAHGGGLRSRCAQGTKRGELAREAGTLELEQYYHTCKPLSSFTFTSKELYDYLITLLQFFY